MRKYTSSESHEVVSPKAHKAIQENLRKNAATSARELDKEQRATLSEIVDQSQDSC